MEGMGQFIVRRLVGMVAVLFAISVIVFVIFNVLPSGDPARRIAGRQQTPERVCSSPHRTSGRASC